MLMGDSSDNIKGIKGIGAVKSKKIIDKILRLSKASAPKS